MCDRSEPVIFSIPCYGGSPKGCAVCGSKEACGNPCCAEKIEKARDLLQRAIKMTHYEILADGAKRKVSPKKKSGKGKA